MNMSKEQFDELNERLKWIQTAMARAYAKDENSLVRMMEMIYKDIPSNGTIKNESAAKYDSKNGLHR
jgi:hypothetical protein